MVVNVIRFHQELHACTFWNYQLKKTVNFVIKHCSMKKEEKNIDMLKVRQSFTYHLQFQFHVWHSVGHFDWFHQAR